MTRFLVVAALCLMAGGCQSIGTLKTLDSAAQPHTDEVVDFNLEHGVCNLAADIQLRAALRHGGAAYFDGLADICPVWQSIRAMLLATP